MAMLFRWALTSIAKWKYYQLTIVGSVEPGVPGSRVRLDRLEADIQNRLMTMEKHGGMNFREEIRRKRGPGQ